MRTLNVCVTGPVRGENMGLRLHKAPRELCALAQKQHQRICTEDVHEPLMGAPQAEPPHHKDFPSPNQAGWNRSLLRALWFHSNKLNVLPRKPVLG